MAVIPRALPQSCCDTLASSIWNFEVSSAPCSVLCEQASQRRFGSLTTMGSGMSKQGDKHVCAWQVKAAEVGRPFKEVARRGAKAAEAKAAAKAAEVR